MGRLPGKVVAEVDQAPAAWPDREALRRSQRHALIWVAEQQGEIARCIVATVLGGDAHIGQVSIAPNTPVNLYDRLGHQLHASSWLREAVAAG